MLPFHLKRYFWDVDVDSLNLQSGRRFIATRLLEKGDIQASRWLLNNVPREELKELVKKTRNISPRSARFWGLFLGVDTNDIVCLQTSLKNLQKSHWR